LAIPNFVRNNRIQERPREAGDFGGRRRQDPATRSTVWIKDK
jgi:hypothetical protein